MGAQGEDFLYGGTEENTNSYGKEEKGSDKGRRPGPVSDKKEPLAEKEQSERKEKLGLSLYKEEHPD